MRFILRYFLLGTALALAGGSAWGVQTSSRSTGKVLVLENGRTLEGDIERQGDQYRIRRPVGEVLIPAEPGMCLCADWQEAFAFMARQANMLDPDERVRLARWCQLHALHEQALAEVTAALRMQPNHPQAKQLRGILERSIAEKATQPADSAVAKAPAKLPVLDIGSDSVATFTTRVQPILMNTCVTCHNGSVGGNFQLYRTYNGGQRAVTLKNLAAVMPFINPERPELSPLLIKAVSPHGANAQPPLRRDSVPYQTVENWVMYVLAANPQLRANRGAVPARPNILPATVTTTTSPLVQPAALKEREDRAPPTASQSTFSEQRATVPTEPTDPFDPVLFNRQSRSPE